MKNRTITLANGKTVEQPRSHAMLILVLVLAALAAQGRSQIGGVAYLDRGYADFTEILASLGARIYRETKPA